MPSRLAAARRRPSQARGRLRVAKLLRAASSVIAEHGYEAATMSAIAERAGAAIGSLYQFFPNKEAVAEALRAQYTEAQQPRWERLLRTAPRLSAAGLARELIALVLASGADCPAFAALLDAPRTVGSSRRRDLFRRHIAATLRARQPRLDPERALAHAVVVQQVLRGLLSVPAANAADFEEMLAAYLAPRLGDGE